MSLPKICICPTVPITDCPYHHQDACGSLAAMPCSACAEAHAILDADASKIIRNAKDGYPEGREPRELTLAERVKALCIYAADWKRWCEEARKASEEWRETAGSCAAMPIVEHPFSWENVASDLSRRD